MPRSRPQTRLDDLITCAAQVFTERGYRRTQMADVARALGVAPGTLYLYVESKEALFDLVVQRGFRQDTPPLPTLPLKTPAPGTLLRHVRERCAQEMQFPTLVRALASRRPKDMRSELEAIIRELHSTLSRNRQGFRLIEHSAIDWPELAALFFQKMRRELIRQLVRYVQLRMDQGLCRPLPSADIAARMIIESIAWFAMHRHGDLDPALMDEAIAEETVVAILVNGIVKDSQ